LLAGPSYFESVRCVSLILRRLNWSCLTKRKVAPGSHIVILITFTSIATPLRNSMMTFCTSAKNQPQGRKKQCLKFM
jgi:hypothetical protein